MKKTKRSTTRQEKAPQSASADFCNKSKVRLPLASKSVYLDVKDPQQAKQLEAKLKRLGAKVEEFLSKDVNYVISHLAPSRSQSRGQTEGRGSESPAFVNTPSPFGAVPSPTAAGTHARIIPVPATRGKTMAQIACANRSPSPNSVAASAEKLGIKVVTVEAVLKWLDKEMAKLGDAPVQITQGMEARKGRLLTKHSQQLQEPYIKVESSDMHFRPMHLKLNKWPHISVSTPPSSCPFDGQGVMVVQHSDQGDRDGKASVGNWPLPLSQHRASRQREDSSRLIGVPIITTGDLLRQRDLKKHAQRRRGFCECCSTRYDDIKEHVKDRSHVDFVFDKHNYEKLDEVIAHGPSLAGFLQSVVLGHCQQQAVHRPMSSSAGSGTPVKMAQPGGAVKLALVHTKEVQDDICSQSCTVRMMDLGDNDQKGGHALNARLPASRTQEQVSCDADGTVSTAHPTLAAVVIRRPGARAAYGSPCKMRTKASRNPEVLPKEPKRVKERSLIFGSSPLGCLQAVVKGVDQCCMSGKGDPAQRKEGMAPALPEGAVNSRLCVAVGLTGNCGGNAGKNDSCIDSLSLEQTDDLSWKSITPDGQDHQTCSLQDCHDAESNMVIRRLSGSELNVDEDTCWSPKQNPEAAQSGSKLDANRRMSSRRMIKIRGTLDFAYKSSTDAHSSCSANWKMDSPQIPELKPGVASEMQAQQMLKHPKACQPHTVVPSEDKPNSSVHRGTTGHSHQESESRPAEQTVGVLTDTRPENCDILRRRVKRKVYHHTEAPAGLGRTNTSVPLPATSPALKTCRKRKFSHSPQFKSCITERNVLQTPEKQRKKIVSDELCVSPVFPKSLVHCSVPIYIHMKGSSRVCKIAVNESGTVNNNAPEALGSKCTFTAHAHQTSSPSTTVLTRGRIDVGEEARHAQIDPDSMGDRSTKGCIDCKVSKSKMELQRLQVHQRVSKSRKSGKHEAEKSGTEADSETCQKDYGPKHVVGGLSTAREGDLPVSKSKTSTTSLTKKVKLNGNWQLLSDRSLCRLLESEVDASSFLGFTGDDGGLPSDLTFVEASEIEVSDTEEYEWVFDEVVGSSADDSEQVVVETFQCFLPTFSSPDKVSDSSWEDACEVYLNKSVHKKLFTCRKSSAKGTSPAKTSQKT